ncbi:MAG: hypothetical protein U0169_10320 [Polyangiaceae bacterium]
MPILRTSSLRRIGSHALVVVAMGTATACGSDGASTGSDTVPPGAGASADADGGAPNRPIIQAPPCASYGANDAPPCLVDDAAIYVSSTLGDDAAVGTRARPMRTLGAAIERARAKHTRVYACAETYPEAVTLVEGVSLYGSLTCTGGEWAMANVRAKVRAPSSPALVARGVLGTTRVEGFEIFAADQVAVPGAPAASSIAGFVENSTGLTFANARFVAGRGAAGARGIDGRSMIALGFGEGGDGAPTQTCLDDGTVISNLCRSAHQRPRGGSGACGFQDDGSVTPARISGGDGGAGAHGGSSKTTITMSAAGIVSKQVTKLTLPEDGAPLVASVATAPGGTVAGRVAEPGVDGKNGRDAARPRDLGSFDGTRYLPSDGIAGEDGQPGQGGGGGAAALKEECADMSKPCFLATGSGGGAGGCAGLAGSVGRGGGASFALVSLDASVRLEGVSLETSSGGRGGDAGMPSDALPGRNAGANPSGYGANAGAPGGHGGQAGASSGGSGGPSIGLVFRGDEPTRHNVVFTVGEGGVGASASTETRNGRTVRREGAPNGRTGEVVGL